MKKSTAIAISLSLFMLSAILYYVSTNRELMLHIQFIAPDSLRLVAGLVAQGAISYLALAFYVGAKISTEENARAQQRARGEALNEIYERITPARKGIEALCRIQADKEGKIAIDGVDAFNDIASFCSVWRKPQRERRCSPDERALLLEANGALFSFVVCLEVDKREQLNLGPLKAKALAALAEVEKELLKST